MKAIAIITARGGSKRIPKKNIRMFCGKPIIAYSIEAAIASNLFDEVMVSTDSSEIAEIAGYFGAGVPFMRSEQTSNDYATTEDVLMEVLQAYREQEKNFDLVCCLYPTAPFVRSEKLKEAYSLLMNHPEAEAVATVVQYSFPPQRGIVYRDGYIQYQYPENATKRSQDLEPIYHDCGQFYFCRTEALFQHKDLICPRTIPLIMPEEEVQDIDQESDWQIAEIKYIRMIREK